MEKLVKLLVNGSPAVSVIIQVIVSSFIFLASGSILDILFFVPG